jgi:hypothetical protein
VLNVPAALRTVAADFTGDRPFSAIGTLADCASQVDRAVMMLDIARDLLSAVSRNDGPVAVVAQSVVKDLDAARLNLIGTAALLAPPEDSR